MAFSKSIYLKDLHPYEYEHPSDAKALNILQNTRGLDFLIQKFNEYVSERIDKIQYTGSGLKINNENYPELYSLLTHVCDVINLPLSKRPDLYIGEGSGINGMTTGVERSIIVLTSGAIDLLDDDELIFVIGHEVGHIKSGHVLYQQIARFLSMAANIVGDYMFDFGNLLTVPLQIALLEWGRMAEYTADRAGLLACQDIDTATRVMMKLSGMPVKYHKNMKFETFIQQARDFQDFDYDKLNKVTKVVIEKMATHPWTVRRASELLRWIDSGDYDRLLRRETKDRIHKIYDGSAIICRNCNYRLNGTEKFCPNCQHNLQIPI